MGGVFYSLSVPALIAHVRERHLMVAGGALAATGLILIALHVPWMWQIAVYGIFGFGFYLLHGCIQVHVTELSQTARGAAASLHSSFFYLGQAVGPVVYGYGFAHGGPEPSIFVGAAVVMTVGIACSRLLRTGPRIEDLTAAAAQDRAANGLVQSRGNAHHEVRRPGVPRRRG